jgi:hypothetical protein
MWFAAGVWLGGMAGCVGQGARVQAPPGPVVIKDTEVEAIARAGLLGRLSALSNVTVEYSSTVENITLPDSVKGEAIEGVVRRSDEVFRYDRGDARWDVKLAEMWAMYQGERVPIRQENEVYVHPRVAAGAGEHSDAVGTSGAKQGPPMFHLIETGLGLRAGNDGGWDMVRLVREGQVRVTGDGLVELTPRGAEDPTYVFDPAEGYALREIRHASERSHERLVASDFRRVGTVAFPHKIVQQVDWKLPAWTEFKPLQRQTIEVKRVTVNDPLNTVPAMFGAAGRRRATGARP